ncbi:hypothetical protein F7725_022598 [Dissostichus mawsoni]|uniref:DUF1736 domain-containing protein n=1 Tax=Dissostichus mawsoni TaxID=36200 RepID=A0A7J5YZC3_DISMA|nr:hypothetical protein F7725_022598 [Dissostichus mawsoni]
MFAELLCSAVALVLYVNTLGADFCYDDSRAIKTNQDLLPETPWTNIFYDDFWGTLLTHSGSHKSYRPLCTLSFRLNHAVGGLEPWGYHLVNVALHGAVTGLFTSLARLLLGGGLWSLLAGLLFASHPIHTEAVAGCGVAWFLGSLVCAACSMLWKELGVTVLAVSALYDVCVFHKLKLRQVVMLLYKRKNVDLLLNVFVLAAWGVVLLAGRFYWMGNKPPNFSNSDNPAADSPSLLTRMLTFSYLPAANFWLLLCPDMLSFDWSMDALPLIRRLADWRNLYTAAFYLGLFFLAWFSLGRTRRLRARRRTAKRIISPMAEMGTVMDTVTNITIMNIQTIPTQTFTLIIIHRMVPKSTMRAGLHCPPRKMLWPVGHPFLPATNLFFYVGFVIAERVLYIPSMGFCLLVAVGMRSLYVRLRRRSFRTMLVYCSATVVPSLQCQNCFEEQRLAE